MGMASGEKTYVTVQVQGQLGNRLFEVAAAMSYAWDHQCEPTFSNLGYPEVFHRCPQTSVRSEISFNPYYEKCHYLYTLIPFEPGKNLCLQGYFQSEQYFSHHRDELLKLFAPSEHIVSEIERKYGQLLKENTVAVHVRTYQSDGNNPDLNGFRGYPWNYFLMAMDQFPEKNTLFLIFSDSMEWTKKKMGQVDSKNIVFIEGNPSYIDFYLMSRCKHQILSPHSTFSWWAAWLNLNPDKIVISPDGWAPACQSKMPKSEKHKG
jgi:hypothetical protein